MNTNTNQSTSLSVEALQAQIAQLKAQVAAQKQSQGGLSLRVSEKGALSVYGMGRFPVTLYREQWEKLIAQSDRIKAFIEANSSTLKLKEQAAPAAAE